MSQASSAPVTFDASRIDPNALAILERLRGAGFQALLVGGCVRDLLLGQTPKDFDIATDARADQTHGLFEECLMLGGRGSVMTLVFQGGKPFDVATLRPLRTPASTPRVPLDADLSAVARELPVGTVAQDAASRDFSINALFHDPATGQTFDYVGGVADVRARVLRSLGEPSERFRDDPSLVYRALRISARRGLSLEPRTLEALREGVAALPDSPFALRLHELLECLSLGVAGACLRRMREFDVLARTLPSLGRLGPFAWEGLFSLGEAMDRLHAQGRVLGHPARLAALLLPLADPPALSGVDAPVPLAELVPAGDDAERPPLVEDGLAVLAAQRVLRQGPDSAGAAELLGSHLLTEALDVYALTLDATGGSRQVLEAWRARQGA